MELIKNIDKWVVCVADLRNQIHSITDYEVLFETLALLNQYEAHVKNLHDAADVVEAAQNKVKRQLYDMLTKLEKQIGLPFVP